MKTCEGCGSFYNKKCDYCGYEDDNWNESDEIEFSTLRIEGNMNNVKVKYGDSLKKNEVLIGNMQDLKIKAKFLNIIVKGNMNDINIKRKVEYVSIVKGNMNDIG